MVPLADHTRRVLHGIDQAFTASAWPKPETEWVVVPADDAELAEVLQEMNCSWQELFDSGRVFRVLPDIPILPDGAFEYALPAFMKASLLDETGLWLDVVNRLAPPWKGGTAPQFTCGLGRWTQEQRDGVVAFLQLIVDKEKPKANIVKRLSAMCEHVERLA